MRVTLSLFLFSKSTRFHRVNGLLSHFKAFSWFALHLCFLNLFYSEKKRTENKLLLLTRHLLLLSKLVMGTTSHGVCTQSPLVANSCGIWREQCQCCRGHESLCPKLRDKSYPSSVSLPCICRQFAFRGKIRFLLLIQHPQF